MTNRKFCVPLFVAVALSDFDDSKCKMLVAICTIFREKKSIDFEQCRNLKKCNHSLFTFAVEKQNFVFFEIRVFMQTIYLCKNIQTLKSFAALCRQNIYSILIRFLFLGESDCLIKTKQSDGR